MIAIRRAFAAWLVGAACAPADGDEPPPPPGVSTSAWQALRALAAEPWPDPPPDASNRWADDDAAAAFGQRLFFDPGFSGVLIDPDNLGDAHSLGVPGESGKVACAGCHIPASGFVDDRSVRAQVSLAAGWGRRKAPSLLGVGHATLLMWDGHHDALYNQPFGALESAVEMNSSRLYAAQEIVRRHRAQYEAIFGPIEIPLDDATRFVQLTGETTGCREIAGDNTGRDCHGMPGDGAEYDALAPADQEAVTRIWVNAGKAIGAYERRLTCGPGRFDAWLAGDDEALDAAEVRGAALFVGERSDGNTFRGCHQCHQGPLLTDQQFHNVGLAPRGVGPAGSFIDPDDRGAIDGLAEILDSPLNVRGVFSDGDDGRLPDTIAPHTEGAYRTPSLRCVGVRPAFMHTGQIRNLHDAVAFFVEGGAPSGYPGTNELTPSGLDEDEQADLTAFLFALEGEGPAPDLLEAPE